MEKKTCLQEIRLDNNTIGARDWAQCFLYNLHFTVLDEMSFVLGL